MALPDYKWGATQIAGTVAGGRCEPRNDFPHIQIAVATPPPAVRERCLGMSGSHVGVDSIAMLRNASNI